MNFFHTLFRKRAKSNVPPMPSWDAIVQMLYDKQLDNYAQKVVQVIYSKDRSKRYVICKNDNGFFTHQLEAIYQYDPDEWQYIASNQDALPAMWEPFHGMTGKSVFENEEELLTQMRVEPEYQQYF